jgi:AraC-like DNA-binding protein/tetratricopeptide (TPR) repeat protein
MDGMDKAQLIKPDGQGLLPQHVKRAVAFMRGNMAERITLAEVTSAGGVSERTLLKQFQAFLGVPPLTYLRRLRLDAAKSELTNPGNNEPISDIAARCGFTHLGRFAAEYRRQFNETPTAARQRARASTARSGANSAASQPCRVRPSLLILPLRTETLRESQEARDLTERLAATLSRIRIASVSMANLSRPLSMTAPQPRNAGSQYCLHGRLIQRDERLRVIVRLVDVAADRHIWGDSYDGSVNDPFALQDRVVDGVLFGVVSHLTDAETERANEKDPNDLGAREVALRALPLIRGASTIGTQQAVAILDRAVDMDPADAVAAALLAISRFQLVLRYGTESPAIAMDAAARLSQRAMALDSDDPLVLVACGGVAHWLRRFDEADTLLARALAIDPTSAWAWERYGYSLRPCLSSGARDSGAQLSRREAADHAIAGFQRALKLSGPDISRSNCFHGIASAHVMADRWEAARVWMHRALAEDPGGTWIHRNVFSLAFKTGDSGSMTRSVEHMRRAYPHLTVSYHADNLAASDPLWLEALRNAGMPLT